MEDPEFTVVWPLHRDHYLTIAPRELGERHKEKPPEPAPDYSVILDACSAEWQSVREIGDAADLHNPTLVCIYLLRGVKQGALERCKVEWMGKPRWVYRRTGAN